MFALPRAGVGSQLLAAQLATALASLAINIVAARTMGPEGRGTLALALQLAYVVTTLCTLGVDKAYPAVRPHGQQPDLKSAHGDLVRLVVAPTAICCGLVAVVGCTTPLLGEHALVYSGGFVILLIGNVLLVLMRSAASASSQAADYVRAVVITQSLLLTLALTLAVASADNTQTWLAVYGASLAVPAACCLLLRRRGRVRKDHATARRTARRMGTRLMPAAISNMVMLRSDRLLIPLFGSTEQLGLYVVVATITETLAWPVQAYVDSRIPHWAQAHCAGSLSLRRVGMGIGAVLALCVLLVGGVASVAVVPLFGTEYRPSLNFVWPLAVAAGLYGMARLGVGVSIARGRPSHALAIEVTGMVAAFAAYLLLIPALAALGAAWGCFIGYGTGTLAAAILASWPATRGRDDKLRLIPARNR
jgi:O-antigen/teichoic acid export membrane protein